VVATETEPAETPETLLWAAELARQAVEADRWEITQAERHAAERESAFDDLHEPQPDGTPTFE
jgi:hypothetical protein